MGKNGVAGLKCGANACLVGLSGVGGDSPGTAVDEQGWGIGGRVGHGDMLEQPRGLAGEPFWAGWFDFREGVKDIGAGEMLQVAENTGVRSVSRGCREFHGNWISLEH